MVSTSHSRILAGALGLGFFALMPVPALAHCDALDGPVVKAAQRALEHMQQTPDLRDAAKG